MKVMVRIPTRGNPHMCNAAWVAWAQRMRPAWDIAYHPNTMCVALARNEIVREARESDASHLIMIDDDVVPPTSLFNLPQHGVHIVSGVVPTWRNEALIWSVYEEEDGKRYSLESFHDGLNEVDSVGGACLCIRRDVFNNDDLLPLFAFGLNNDGTLAKNGGEDIAFCKRAALVGYKILVDPHCVCEHLQRIDLAATKVAYDAHIDPDHRRTPLHRPDIGLFETDGATDTNHSGGRQLDATVS
jgi:hypothetical protein